MSVSSRAERIEAMLVKQPNDPFLLYALALEYSKAGRDQEAIDRLRALTSTHPDYHPTYQQLGQTLIQQGETEEARQWLSKGIDAANRSGDAHSAGEMEGMLISL
jgi:predicted Zn-dependent protease